MSIFKDILTETEMGRTKYSQGRVYLFIAFAVFFVINIIMGLYGLKGWELKEKETLDLVSSNLKWALGAFALYVLGNKGVGMFRDNYGPRKPDEGEGYPGDGPRRPGRPGKPWRHDDEESYNKDYNNLNDFGDDKDYYKSGSEEVD